MKKLSLLSILILNFSLAYSQWSENASNVWLTNSNKSVGIGTSSPKQKLHVVGDYYGRGALYLYSYSGDGTNGNAFVQGRDDSGTSDITLILRSQDNGALNNAVVIRPDGKVDIATTFTSGFTLQVNGTAAKPGGGSWSTLSDGRLKSNVRPFEDGLNIINKINPVWFSYNGELGIKSNQQFVGTIAQDLAKTAPYMVEESRFTEYDSASRATIEKNYLTADYSALNFVLVNAIKEQQKMIDEQNNKISQLEKRLESLESKINRTSDTKLEEINLGSYREGTDVPKLSQSYPNPSQGELVIPYYLPPNSENANIIVYDFQGKEILSKKLTNKGHSSISISGLKDGLYYYSLLSDGQDYGIEKIIVRH